MYAIIETGGKQFRVQEGKKIVVDRLSVPEGTELTLDRVLMVGGDTPQFGTPTVEGVKITATVLEHSRGEKVLVFKKWRRNDSRKLRGHRQDYTTLKVTGIQA